MTPKNASGKKAYNCSTTPFSKVCFLNGVVSAFFFIISRAKI